MSRITRAYEKFGANDADSRWRVMSDMISALCMLRGTEFDDIYQECEFLHKGGEFCYDGAVEAVINGWRRKANGALPAFGKINGVYWYEYELPGSDDRALNAFVYAVDKLRNFRREECLREKEKRRKRRVIYAKSKALREAGYTKMWVNTNHVEKLSQFLSSIGKEFYGIKTEDGVVRIIGVED